MICLTAHGARVSDVEAQVARLADEFARTGTVVLPRFIESSLLRRIQSEIDRSALYERRHGAIASELCMPENACLGLLHFLVNDPRVFTIVEAVTGTRHLTAFNGRVYRRLPGEHFDSWHTDVHPDRMVGMSINLSTDRYEGGRFEIRHEGTTSTLASVANVGPGDAMLFAIRDGLEHQVTRVEGTAAKTAFAGWFGAHRDYNDTLRRDRTLQETA
jgi:hypothetical protein